MRDVLEEEDDAVRRAGLVARRVPVTSTATSSPPRGERRAAARPGVAASPRRRRAIVARAPAHRRAARRELADAGEASSANTASTAPTARGRVDARAVLGRGAVHGGDAAVGVGRDDAGGDVREDGLEVAAALLELGAAASSGRAVMWLKAVDQRADLVVALAGDALVEVALRDLARALGEALDRHRDAARDVEAEPGGREEDDEA